MTNIAYVRWKTGEPRLGRDFSPLTESHPAFAESCVLCDDRIGIDEHHRNEENGSVVLVAIRATDPEENEKAEAGKWHTCAAVIVHKCCADVLSEEDYEVLSGALVVESIQSEIQRE
jgi:hypothetical protein